MIIVHRRHSITNEPYKHLSKEGITLAKNVGRFMGKFDYVLTSTATRAVETAVTMGYAIDEDIDFSSTLSGDAADHREIPEGTPFTEYSKRIGENTSSATWGQNV